jgi:DNA-directed RNA polymerase specialized sigma24 family protein
MTSTRRGNHSSNDYDDHQDNQRQQQRDRLNQVIADIVKINEASGYSMILAIRRMIHQFKLQSRLHPADILHTAYLRAIDAIDSGKSIQDYRSWLKGTALNIVRERSRQLGKETLTDPWLTDQVVPNEPIDEAEDQIEQVLQAFNLLREENSEVAELMNWRLLEGLSWLEIQNRLGRRDGSVPSLEALRQKASRAKRRLRHIFHSLDNRCSISSR